MAIKCIVCGNDIWEDRGNGTANCSNCLVTRPYIHRQRGTKQTPSQKAAVARIKGFFTRCGDLGCLKVEMKSGLCWVAIETTGNVFARRGGFFSIGRRGGVTCQHAYDFAAEENETAKHYNRIMKK